jgi:hypothetical protein
MAASGIVAEPTHLLAELVAASPTFQTVTGTASEAEALDFVHEVSVAGSEVVRPFAVVSAPMGHAIGRGGFGTGELTLIFEDAVPEGYTRDDLAEGSTDEPDSSDGSEAFRNWVGAVVHEMMDEQENGGRLLVRQIVQDGLFVRSAAEDKADYFQLRYKVQWGASRR